MTYCRRLPDGTYECRVEKSPDGGGPGSPPEPTDDPSRVPEDPYPDEPEEPTGPPRRRRDPWDEKPDPADGPSLEEIVFDNIGNFFRKAIDLVTAPVVVSNLDGEHNTHLIYEPLYQRFEVNQQQAIDFDHPELPNKLRELLKSMGAKTSTNPSEELRQALRDIELLTDRNMVVTTRFNISQSPSVAGKLSQAGFNGSGRGPFAPPLRTYEEAQAIQDYIAQNIPQEFGAEDFRTILAQQEAKNIAARRAAFEEARLAAEAEKQDFSANALAQDFSQNPFAQNSFGGTQRAGSTSAQLPKPEDLKGYLEGVDFKGLLNRIKPQEKKRNVIDKIMAEERLSDKELKEALEFLQAIQKDKTKESIDFAKKVRSQLVKNISEGPSAMKSEDGYIIIGKQAYGTKEAPEKARKDLEYFEKTGKHLPPLHPVDPNLPLENYENITTKVIFQLEKISTQVKEGRYTEKIDLFKDNFPNNQPWDLQVNYGLTGQQLILDKNGIPKIDPNRPDLFLTQDQFAIFERPFTGDPIQDMIIKKNNEKPVRRAGYISNYAYGYASAAAGFSLLEALGYAEAASIYFNHKPDNTEDIIAIIEGWYDYTKKQEFLDKKLLFTLIKMKVLGNSDKRDTNSK